MAKEVTISPKALATARDAGLFGDTEKRVRRMLQRSAPVTHELGNRRFQNFVIHTENNTVLGVYRVQFNSSNHIPKEG